MKTVSRYSRTIFAVLITEVFFKYTYLFTVMARQIIVVWTLFVVRFFVLIRRRIHPPCTKTPTHS